MTAPPPFPDDLGDRLAAVTLIGLLVDASRKTRRERTKRDGDSTGSN